MINTRQVGIVAKACMSIFVIQCKCNMVLEKREEKGKTRNQNQRENKSTAQLFSLTFVPVSQQISSHYNDAIMSAMASQITGVSIVYSIVCSDADKRKHQSSTSLAFVGGIYRWPVKSQHKWPVTQKMFLFNDVIMVNTESIFYFRSAMSPYKILDCVYGYVISSPPPK